MEVKIPIKIMAIVEEEQGGEIIEEIYLEFGHHIYVKINKDLLPESFWEEIWKHIEKKEVQR